jgi:hypothetical protein
LTRKACSHTASRLPAAQRNQDFSIDIRHLQEFAGQNGETNVEFQMKQATRKKLSGSEVEQIMYPLEWVEEFKRDGFPRVWLSDFPELFEESNGVHKPYCLPRPDSHGSYGFADYALMYLLRKHEGICSTTYFEIGLKAKKSKPKAKARRDSVQGKLRRWMGNADFERLQQALWDTGKKTYKGEPDLFCWYPDSGEWFFAEAKSPTDTVKEGQEEWWKVCGKTFPNVRIVTYYLSPDLTAGDPVTPTQP